MVSCTGFMVDGGSGGVRSPAGHGEGMMLRQLDWEVLHRLSHHMSTAVEVVSIVEGELGRGSGVL